jgi:DNA-binding transcriptional ArsR family regulator
VGKGCLIYNEMFVDGLTEEEVDRLFQALAETTRRDILHRCIRGEPSVSQLADLYPISLPTVQKHVAVLERAGPVSKERHGRERLVRTDGIAVARARQILDELETVWRGRVGSVADLLGQAPPQRARSSSSG